MSKRVLLVEPDSALCEELRDSLQSLAQVDDCRDFPAARARLSSTSYDWLVTNLRLDAYNGLHLVHLAAVDDLSTRSLVYGERRDLSLAREAQRLGAFYESRDHLPQALPAYVLGKPPGTDRRDPIAADRRSFFRGGRRAADLAPALVR